MRLKQHQRLGEHQSTQPTAPTTPAVPSTPFIPSTKHEPAAAHAVQGAHPVQAAHAAQAPEPSPRERRIEQHLGKLPFGSWFEFVDPTTGQIARRKLAWHSPMSGRCLLVSRRGQRGEEMTLTQLAHEIAAGRVCEVPEQRESMLDRAWRSLTGNLRQSAAKRLAAPQEPDRR
jgi:hypothetical protein